LADPAPSIQCDETVQKERMQRRAEAVATQTAQLVVRARRGDRDAYGELVELMWPQLVALARTILAGDDEAEDVVQEDLVHAWSRLGSLRQPERFPAWIRRIVSRRCFAHLRRPRAVAVPLPQARSEPRIEGIDIERMLSRLAPRQRAVIYLTVVEGHSAREAAAVLGILPATARVHRHRAMAHLRRALEDWR
jgi:RNA polymerase sigma-70 factor (ECF subfamily)